MTEEEQEALEQAELEAIEDMVDELGNPLSKTEAYKRTEEFKSLAAEVKQLQPMRIGVFKRYWDKFKYNRQRRELLIEMFDTADEQVKFYLRDDFRSWKDEIPGVREFLAEIQHKQVLTDKKQANAGNTVVR